MQCTDEMEPFHVPVPRSVAILARQEEATRGAITDRKRTTMAVDIGKVRADIDQLFTNRERPAMISISNRKELTKAVQEKLPQYDVVELSYEQGYSMGNPDITEILQSTITGQRPMFLWISTSCGAWSAEIWAEKGPGLRSPEQKREHNRRVIASAIRLCSAQVHTGGHVIWEWPTHAEGHDLVEFQNMVTACQLKKTRIIEEHEGGRQTRGPRSWTLYSNNEHFVNTLGEAKDDLRNNPWGLMAAEGTRINVPYDRNREPYEYPKQMIDKVTEIIRSQVSVWPSWMGQGTVTPTPPRPEADMDPEQVRVKLEEKYRSNNTNPKRVECMVSSMPYPSAPQSLEYLIVTDVCTGFTKTHAVGTRDSAGPWISAGRSSS